MLNEQTEAQRFEEFAEGLLAKENAAAAELLDRYSQRIVRVAGQQLGPKLAAKVDPEDVLQSVLRTFYRRLGAGEVELRDWASLSGFLSLLALRKCQRQAERFAAAGRDLRREIALDSARNATVAIPDREPTPDEVAAFTELVESMLDRSTERDRRIIDLLFAGTAIDDIAADVCCSRRTVYRTVAWVQGELIAAEFDDPAASDHPNGKRKDRGSFEAVRAACPGSPR